MKFVRVSGGVGWMGRGFNRDSVFGLPSNSSPLHTVSITKSFYIGTHEVTQSQYKLLTGSNPSFFCENGEGRQLVTGLDTRRFPVEQVTWEDAVRFCELLSKVESENNSGRVYRLPTEAEWEFACRAIDANSSLKKRLDHSLAALKGRHESDIPEDLQSQLTFSFGHDSSLLENHGWFSDNSENRTHAIEGLTPNGFGIFDTSGNVSEWCSDWYGHSYYEANYDHKASLMRLMESGNMPLFRSRDATTARTGDGFGLFHPSVPIIDPTGPKEDAVLRMKDKPLYWGNKAAYWGNRVTRGGSWADPYSACQADSRSHAAPSSRHKSIGFRVVFTEGNDNGAK